MQSESNNESVAGQARLQLWPFALQLYQAEGMERICLELQDVWGINVNLLLWSAWLDYQRFPVDPGFQQRVRGRATLWHSGVIVALRKLRRLLPKSGLSRWLRAKIGKLEQVVEKRELNKLERLTQNLYCKGTQKTGTSGGSYLLLALAGVPASAAAQVIKTCRSFSPDQTDLG